MTKQKLEKNIQTSESKPKILEISAAEKEHEIKEAINYTKEKTSDTEIVDGISESIIKNTPKNPIQKSQVEKIDNAKFSKTNADYNNKNNYEATSYYFKDSNFVKKYLAAISKYDQSSADHSIKTNKDKARKFMGS